MIRLIGYELKKIFRFKGLFSLLCLCLCLNTISVIYQQIRKYDDPVLFHQEYQQLLSQYQVLGEEQYHTAYAEEYERLEIMSALQQSSSDAENYAQVLAYQLDRSPELTQKLLDNQEEWNTENAEIRLKALQKMNQEYQYIQSFHDNVDTVISQAQQMMQISIFQTSDESVKNIEKTRKDYEKLQNVEIVWRDHLATDRFLHIQYTEWFLLFLLILGLSALIVNEQNSGMMELLKTTINGRKKTWFCKWIALTVYALVIIILFYLNNAVMIHFFYQFQYINDSIQSIQGFANLPYLWTGIETMLAMVGIRTLTLVSFMTVCFAMLIIFENGLFVSGLVLTFSVLQGVIYYLVPLQSNLKLLRYFNLFSFFDMNFVFYEYHNLIIFHHAWTYHLCMLSIMVMLIIVSGIILFLGHPVKIRKISFAIPYRFNFSLSHHCLLFFHEIKKSFIDYKGGIVLSFFILILIFQKNPYIRTYYDQPYQQLIQQFHGALSEDKMDTLDQLEQNIQTAQQELDEASDKLSNQMISSEQYYKIWSETMPLLNMSSALQQIRIQIMQADKNDPAIVDVQGYEYLFDSGVDNTKLNGIMMQYIFILIALIGCIAPLEVMEKRQNLLDLYRVSWNNEKRFHGVKQGILLFYVLVIAIIFSSWKYQRVAANYFLTEGNFALANVYNLMIFVPGLSLKGAYFAVCVIRFIVLLLIGEIVCFFSRTSDSIFSVILKSCSLLLLPLILQLCGLFFLIPYNLSFYFTSASAFVLSQEWMLRILMIGVILCGLTFLNIRMKS